MEEPCGSKDIEQNTGASRTTLPTLLQSSLTQAALLGSWILNPLKEVGPTSVPLLQAESGRDSAHRAGCKAQAYTSWDVYSRSYSVYYACYADAHREKRHAEGETRDPLDGDIPTQEEMEDWTDVNRQMYAARKKRYFRGIGLLTLKQMQHKKYLRRIRARCARSDDESSDEPEEGSSVHTVVTRSITKKKTTTPLETTRPTSVTQSLVTGEQKTSQTEEHTATTDNPIPSLSQTSTKKNTPRGPISPSVYWYSDTVPVRVVQVSNWLQEYEKKLAVPYSPMFTSLAQRLADPAATGALGAMTRGPTVRDATSILALAKYLATSTSSVMEVGPLVRVLCMALSLTQDNYRSEIINHRIIRGWKMTQYLGPEITTNRITQPQVSRIIAIPLDLYTAFMLDKQPPLVAGDVYSYSKVDYDWTAVPMRSELARQRGIIPYMASFLTSRFWAGTVNHAYMGTLTSADGNHVTRVPTRIMPASNSVYLEGPTDVLIVLTDYTASACPNMIRIGNIDIDTFSTFFSLFLV